MTWVLDITEKANQITGLDISPFTTVFSPEVGTVVWSMVAPDLAALESANDKLVADDGYIVLIDEGARLVQSNIDDGLLQIIHGEVNPDRRVEYATSVQAVCATGNLARGMELGVEIAQRAEQAIGIPTMFASSMNGPYGAIAWVTGFTDVHEMDRAQQTLAADTDFMRFIDDKTPGVYAEDFAISQQLTYRRIV
jgi:hypothetical protein